MKILTDGGQYVEVESTTVVVTNIESNFVTREPYVPYYAFGHGQATDHVGRVHGRVGYTDASGKWICEGELRRITLPCSVRRQIERHLAPAPAYVYSGPGRVMVKDIPANAGWQNIGSVRSGSIILRNTAPEPFSDDLDVRFDFSQPAPIWEMSVKTKIDEAIFDNIRGGITEIPTTWTAPPPSDPIADLKAWQRAIAEMPGPYGPGKVEVGPS